MTFFGTRVRAWRGPSMMLTEQLYEPHQRISSRPYVCVAIALAFLVAASCKEKPHVVPTLEEASRAAYASDYREAARLYAAVAADAATPAEDRQKAEIALANIEWRIDGNPAAARVRLARVNTRAAMLERARLEHEYRRFDDALAFARKAVELSKTADETRTAKVAVARVLIDREVIARLESRPVSSTENLREGFTIVKESVDRDPGRLIPALLLLRSSILLGEGEAALEAWRAYFGPAAQSTVLAPQAATLARILPSWHGQPSPELVNALAGSRLFDEAVLAGATGDVVTYASYIRRLKHITEDYYRDLANKRADRRAYAAALERQTAALCKTLGIPFDKKMLDGEIDTPLAQRFGSLIAAGKTGSVYNLHFGHRVVDDKQTVNQYGHTAAVRFIQLDTMVSNGFESWSRDGRSQHGGWGDVGFIVQVRPAYAEGPIATWNRINDPELRDKWEKEIAKETAADWQRSAHDPYAYLPGLADRLEHDSKMRLIEELRARGLSGNELRAAFIAELAHRVNESSITAHEGRHAIDAQDEKITKDAELEYRAKLSEIAFAIDPKLAITSGIISEDIGSSTPHGIADSRIMHGLVDWMSAHAAEIAGLDRGKPLLPQLDKLTDDQLRAAASSMDPFAKK